MAFELPIQGRRSLGKGQTLFLEIDVEVRRKRTGRKLLHQVVITVYDGDEDVDGQFL